MYGILSVLISDNGAQFTSNEFQDFANNKEKPWEEDEDIANLLRPQTTDISLEKMKKRLKNLKSAWYDNRTSKGLDPYEEGDMERVRPSTLGVNLWKKGTVSQRLDDRS
ncbi:hypothetical protein Pcinc_001531 [Petrolisthes cinctipes]|uniref:Integrase catalytic domain-containing protein n=1 Tax=Petrolisthes cinctipes TaxID=88211 RepID=A0AAE1GL35_PETCI|nr:hypothetical protein Pcinc_001531 [Petrolisthes cinctipes]